MEFETPCIRDPKTKICPQNCPSHERIKEIIEKFAKDRKLSPEAVVDAMRNVSDFDALTLAMFSREEFPCKNYSGQTQKIDITNLFGH